MSFRRSRLVFAGLAALTAWGARAERIENSVAVFAALDKVTANISTFQVPLNETRQFGALKVTPRACYSRSPTEQPQTTSFVEVDEIELDGEQRRIFSGWMFAESPGLNAVEHPVFDVWLTDCKEPKGSVAQRGQGEGPEAADQPPPDDPFEPERRRVRR